jgi:hypothetical protein
MVCVYVLCVQSGAEGKSMHIVCVCVCLLEVCVYGMCVCAMCIIGRGSFLSGKSMHMRV